MIEKSNYVFTYISSICTILFTIGGYFISNKSLIDTYIIFMIGSIITFAFTGLKIQIQRDLKLEIKKLFHIYSMIENVENDEIKSHAYDLIKNISNGILPAHIAHDRRLNLLAEVKSHIHASAFHYSLENLKSWENTWLKHWEDVTSDLANRGDISVERIFIVPMKEIIRDNKIDEYALSLFKRQQDKRVIVKIIWEEKITCGDHVHHIDMRSNFTIFDDKEVLVTDPNGQKMYRNPSDELKKYIGIFKKQERIFSEPLDAVIKKFPRTGDAQGKGGPGNSFPGCDAQ